MTYFANPSQQIFTQTDSVTVASTASSMTLVTGGYGSLTLPPATFDVSGRSVLISANGIFSTNTVSPTLTMNACLNSTTAISMVTDSLVTGISNKFWAYQGVITCRGTGVNGVLMGQGWMIQTNTIGATAAVDGTGSTNGVGSTSIIDTTASQTLDLRAMWSAANGGNSFVVTNLVVQKL